MHKASLKHFPWSEVMRFGAMGLLSTGLYLVLLIPIRKYVQGPLWLLGAFAYVLCMAVNYVLQRRVTFKSDRRHQEAFVRFAVVQLTALALNSVLLEVLVQRLSYPFWLGQGIAVCATSVFSYVAQKIWVFMSKSKQSLSPTE